MKKSVSGICLAILLLFQGENAFSFQGNGLNAANQEEEIGKVISSEFQKGGIPGLSVVVIYPDTVIFENYGYYKDEKKSPVSQNTLFQIGSCSKAFVALAVQKLADEGIINLDEKVSAYIPWFRVNYKKNEAEISIRQLLNQTSGIPWNTLAKIPVSNDPNALEMTVKTLVGTELNRLPGKQFEYATINYDVLALVVEKVTKLPFESYLQQQILTPLRLSHTSMGTPVDSNWMSEGYKIGFFKPRKYEAPVYRGNNPAGYITTNTADMAKWLRYQMNMDTTPLTRAMDRTHLRDETVTPVNNVSYASGWFVSLNGDHLIYHEGENPNFTAFIGFDPIRKYGVAVLANSNSTYASIIGRNVLNLLAGKKMEKQRSQNDSKDRIYSTACLILGAYILLVLAFMGYVLRGMAKGSRVIGRMSASKAIEAVLMVGILIPVLYGLYKLPNAMAGFNWNATRVWMPQSFFALVLMILASIAISYLAYGITLFFPDRNKYRGAVPRLVLISGISGVSNMILILLITSTINANIEAKFLLFYFGLAFTIYLAGRRFVQIRLIKITRDLIYDLRVQLIDRIFKTSYQWFEKIDSGRIYTALNDDVGTIGESTTMFIMLVTNLFTAMAAGLYLTTIAFWATLLILLLVIILSSVYYFISRRTHRYFEEARDSRTVFVRLLNGMIDGYKEICLHLQKKALYKEDISESANEYRIKMSTASILYVNASLVGEIVLISVLGTVAFAFPVIFPDIPLYAISMFIVVLLYLIGPVNAILQSVPTAMRLRVAWNRVQQFLREIPANVDIDPGKLPERYQTVNSLRTENLRFQYEGEHPFDIGPIDLEVNSGEILFIIGGNGSGKTTLAKLLTGLYKPSAGNIYINGKEEPFSQLGEKFSAVFNPAYLFEKLYNIETTGRTAEITAYLELLDIKHKVGILDNGTFSTINLSGGQRKRLALLLCYLEDSPIYLFDEWAADQDPEYRKFFYRTLLPEMRKKGKIVIAITHDDHYFDVADRVVKMNQGKIKEYAL
jgi:putative ATP-binding cassette transporter